MAKFEFINHYGYLFSARTCPNFSLFFRQVKRVVPFDFALERDLKNIFYYQRDIENYMDPVLNFFLFDRHQHTHWIFWSVILVSILMLRVYVTFSLFFKIWLTELILISRELLFRGTCFLLASNALRHKFFWRK